MVPLSRIDVSPQKAAQFNSKGIACVEDLVSFFPRKYYNFLKQTKIADLVDGAICRVSGEIVSCTAYNRVEAVLRDDTGEMKITWFGGCYFASRMTPGAKFTFCGRVADGPRWFSPCFMGREETTWLAFTRSIPKSKGCPPTISKEKSPLD